MQCTRFVSQLELVKILLLILNPSKMLMFSKCSFFFFLQQELVYFTFNRHAGSNHTTALEFLLQRCNDIQLWVMTEVLLCPTLCKRVQLIKKFIKIAAQLVLFLPYHSSVIRDSLTEYSYWLLLLLVQTYYSIQPVGWDVLYGNTAPSSGKSLNYIYFCGYKSESKWTVCLCAAVKHRGTSTVSLRS